MPLIIVFGPLIGSIIAGLFGKWIGDRAAMLVTTVLLGLSAVLSIWMFYDVAILGNERTIPLATWISIGDFEAVWSIKLDTLSAVMLVVVTSVSSLVHLYSWGYMADDPHRSRFFSYLSLFTFAMLALVTADDFLQLFFGWEGVGLASYLLIGFWYKKKSANDAAIKAFVTNRVGDFGFALGIMAVFAVFGSIGFDQVFAAIGDHEADVLALGSLQFQAIELAAFLLFIGAMGKSAQFFLHVWLPDAMEGPTPVSALIHAATMVTAGVFLVCRCWPIFEASPNTSAFITVIGATTALFAATVGVAQNDIKRVVAYSTCSQLGYMFFAAGLGLYGAAMFHLFTHAFFKALLFLGSGSVIHGLHHEQDMRKMGGIYKALPFTWILMIIGTLALTGVGIPLLNLGFAGFYSKDAIIEGAFMAGQGGLPFGVMAFWVGTIAALLTSFYSWRLIFMTFHGKYRGPKEVLDHAHDAPAPMMIPLVLLAVGAIFAGALFRGPFIGEGSGDFWRDALPSAYHGTVEESHDDDGHGAADEAHGEVAADSHGAEHRDDVIDQLSPAEAASLDAATDEADHAAADDHAAEGDHGGGHHPPTWVLFAPFVATLIGFLGAIWFYLVKEGMGARIAARGGPLHAFLYNKWYFDEIYRFVFVRGAEKLGDLFWKVGDRKIIDGFGPNGFAGSAMSAARRLSKAQSGYLYHYAFVMLIGVVLLTLWVVARTGGQ
ncbi:NADH-quinone oxidoreductase subunit L [Hyphobacterium marinum]|uniref:NADH-quinone oxidoreductase subunit L n=1 Tax=Hyphobacterium marinum TaxID=3116574 RepID=A0ABU7M158_9PROT|nr:NADH-quinone oxidoreductase subunit L [Hyphobacterium sp. Y6023]MEE2567552.1 NADH-quinone oxidoreductase subunit L [Hyphobacterium sp. Y6023]